MNIMEDYVSLQKQAKEEQDDKDAGMDIEESDLSGEEISIGASGFDRFKHLMQDNMEEASALLKQWLKSDDKSIHEALAVLSRLMSVNEMKLSFFCDNTVIAVP